MSPRLACVFLLAVLVLPARSLAVEHGGRLFPETGWRVRGRLLSFWEQSGGLPVFGLPLGPERETKTPEGSYIAQLFERERLELHPELEPPYDVLLGRLGDELLRRQGRDWRTEGDGAPPTGTCRRFPQTDRSVCGLFLEYWREHGLDLGDSGVSERESLALFGLPLTAPRVELNSSGDNVLTQWFERARFEFHPSNPPPYQVLLGRLGAEFSGETSTALPDVSVRVAPEAARQGHTIGVEVTLAEAVAVRGTLGGAALPLVRGGGAWRGLAGVPVLVAPGRLPLRVEADLPDGRTVVKETAVTVLDARYPRESINLPPAVNEAIENNHEQVQRERDMVNAIWQEVTPRRLWTDSFAMPAAGRITSRFGTLRSYNGGPYDSFHEGLDIANAAGTPIYAPAPGRVVLAETGLLVRGGAIILDHGLGVHSGYWHQSQILVKVGDMVERGQLIGRMGAEGMVTGSHLHWELRVGMASVNPEEWMAQEFR